MVKVTVELPEIEGFEFIGEYRFPNVNEYFLLPGGEVQKALFNFTYNKHFILRTKKRRVLRENGEIRKTGQKIYEGEYYSIPPTGSVCRTVVEFTASADKIIYEETFE